MTFSAIDDHLIRCRVLLESLKQMLFCAQEMEQEQKANCVTCAIFLSAAFYETLAVIEEKTCIGPNAEGANEN